MKKLKDWQEELKIIGEWCGMAFSGIDQEDEPNFIGTKQQWEDYDLYKDRELHWDDDGKLFSFNEDEENTKTYFN